MANEFKIKNGYLSEGNSQVTGSLNVSGGITGSLFGTASYATNAISASYTPLTIGTTAITSGTDTRLLYQSAGVLSQSANLTFNGTALSVNNGSIIGAMNSNSFVSNDNLTLTSTPGSVLIQSQLNSTIRFVHSPLTTANISRYGLAIGFGATYSSALIDVKSAGALSTDIAFRVRNSADTANLGAIYGNGTVNLGNSNFNFQSTETSGRTAVIGSSNTGASYNTYSILSILGHNNNIIGYGHTSYVGINSSINQNSGGTVTGMGESNTLVGGTIGIGMNNNIAGSANGNMNTGIGYNNAIQYEKTNTFLLGNNLRVSAAGAASMTKIGWADSAGTLAQIDRSFEVYLNGQSGSDFHVTGKTNVVLKNNSVLVSGTNYEAAATNTLTIHNGVAPTTNITGAFQLYSSASSATILGSLVVNQTSTTQSLNTSTRTLFDSSSRSSVSWDNRGLIDSSGGVSVDWQDTFLKYGSITSLDWRNRITYDTSTSSSIKWDARQLWDADPLANGYNTASLDWNNRIAKDTNAKSSIDWGNKVLLDNNQASALHWKFRILYTPDSTTALNWSDDTYLDSNVYQRDYKSSVTQNAVSNNYNNPYKSYLGDVIEVDGITIFMDNTVTEGMLVYLNTNATWYPVDQASTVSTKLLGIAHNVAGNAGFILLEGHVVIDDTSTSGPNVQSPDHGLPIYIKDNTTTGEMSTIVPTTTGGNHVIRILGHCYWNNSGTATQWMMKFRPSNDWVEI